MKKILRKASERPAFELSLEMWKGVCLVAKPMKGDYKEGKLHMFRGTFA